MAKYKIAGDGIKDTETGRLIPKDPCNRHYCEYLYWCAGLDMEDESVDEDPREPDPEFTPEEEAAKAIDVQKAALLEGLRDTDQTLLKLIVVMYQVGLAKGVWEKSDFEGVMPGIVDTVQSARQKLSEYESLFTAERN